METIPSKIPDYRGRLAKLIVGLVFIFAFNATVTYAEPVQLLAVKQNANGSLLYAEYGVAGVVKYTEVYTILNRNSNQYICMQGERKVFSTQNIEVVPNALGRFKPQQELMQTPDIKDDSKSSYAKCLWIEGKFFCPHIRD